MYKEKKECQRISEEQTCQKLTRNNCATTDCSRSCLDNGTDPQHVPYEH